MFRIPRGHDDHSVYAGLKVSLRWGCKPNARQMRLTVMRLSPLALAKPRVLQWGLSAGRAFQGLNHHLLDLGIAYFAGRSWPGLVVESFQASFQKARAPFAHHAQRGPHFSRHGFVIDSFGASQHQARAPSQEGLATSPMGQRLHLPVIWPQHRSKERRVVAGENPMMVISVRASAAIRDS
jgi:hypothetical protein